jgi:hypothetical protein
MVLMSRWPLFAWRYKRGSRGAMRHGREPLGPLESLGFDAGNTTGQESFLHDEDYFPKISEYSPRP